MIITAVVLFFLIGVVAIYALIQTGKNYALQAVLIPIILVGTLFAGYAIYILQGTPKVGIPEGNVELVFVEMQKPWIIFLSREIPEEDEEGEGYADPIPKYFRIVYNEENKKTMNRLIKRMEAGQKVEGEFKAKKIAPGGIEPPQGEYTFDNIRREGLGPKQTRPEQEDDTLIGIDPGISNRIRQDADDTTPSNRERSLDQPSNYNGLDGAIYPGTTPIDSKELQERTGEQYVPTSIKRQKYTQEELEAFTDSFVDPKYDYYEAF